MDYEDEEITYVRRKDVLHFGSLSETKNEIEVEESEHVEEPALDNEYLPVEERPDDDPESAVVLQEFDRRKKARALVIPTDDNEIKRDLRQLGHPICLFGEGPGNRRSRLRYIVSIVGERHYIETCGPHEAEEKVKADRDNKTWYHEGPAGLKEVRLKIVKYSLPKAQERLINSKKEMLVTEALRMAQRNQVYNRVKQTEVLCSQIADTRPISSCCFNSNGKYLATGSWSGLCKLWSVPDCKELITLRGHISNIGNVVFNPNCTEISEESGMQSSDSNVCDLASCSQDGKVYLWSSNSSDPICELPGHKVRVSRCEFHNSGQFLATCVHDNSWRLWDLEKRKEVLHQEGHSKAVHCIAFQSDGALAVSGGMDSFGRVWDLRTGQCIMFLEGHLSGIVSVDCSPDGYHVVSGGMDNSCKIWDIRTRSLTYTIPAHTNVVSSVKYEKERGRYVVSASYDCTTKLWATDTWHPLSTLKGHDSRIMCCDITRDGQLLVTSSFDRTFKLWSANNNS